MSKNMKFNTTISKMLTNIALIFAIVSITLLCVGDSNTATSGLFGSTSITGVMTETAFEIALLVLILVFSDFQFKGVAGTVFQCIIWALKIIVCVLPALAVIGLLTARVQGLANLYWSDENIQATMQTPENLAAASIAINTCIMYAVTTVVAVVAAFFRPYKRNKVVRAAEAA